MRKPAKNRRLKPTLTSPKQLMSADLFYQMISYLHVQIPTEWVGQSSLSLPSGDKTDPTTSDAIHNCRAAHGNLVSNTNFLLCTCTYRTEYPSESQLHGPEQFRSIAVLFPLGRGNVSVINIRAQTASNVQMRV
jgi:hypothetical protein